jgi:hypothetical protein
MKKSEVEKSRYSFSFLCTFHVSESLVAERLLQIFTLHVNYKFFSELCWKDNPVD